MMKARSTIVPSSNDDPDKLFVCPFDPSHTIKAFKFNQHLRKCQKNHGNHGLRTCTFNQSHLIPEGDFDRHLVECPDKGMIQQDIDAALRKSTHSLPPVNHHPEWNKPESTEDWDSEVSVEPVATVPDEQLEDEAVAEEAAVEYQHEIEGILPEFPRNWESMTATQKKNYRRRFNRQKERLKERGLTAADFVKSKDPRDWTEEERQAKLDLLVSLYPPSKIGGTFIDYKSILNQYCQKNKINQPQYSEAAATFGGYASRVSVKGEFYESHGDHRTKKSAAQSAAMWALMAMEVPEEAQSEQNPTPKLRPARTPQEMQLLKSRHEVGMLHNAGQFQAPSRPVQQNRAVQNERNDTSNSPKPAEVAQVLRTPQSFMEPNNDISHSMRGLSVQPQPNADNWQTVGNRKPYRPGGRAGRGRGTALSSFM